MTNHDFASINIPSKVGSQAWKDCWERAATHGDIIGVQEAFLKRAKQTYLSLAQKHGYAQYGTRMGPNPIFWHKATYKKIEARQVQLHGKGTRYKQYPGFNDARYATVVVLEHRQTSERFAVINTHWVPNGTLKTTVAWRTFARKEAIRRVAELATQYTDRGLPVIIMGDFNIRDPFHLVAGFTWTAQSGVDKIGIKLPKTHKLEKSTAHKFTAPTDHKFGIKSRITIQAKQAPKNKQTYPTDRFRALTWNVLHSIPVNQLAPALDREIRNGVSIGLLQEARGKKYAELLESRGYKITRTGGPRRVFWDPTIWTRVGKARKVTLSTTRWYQKGSTKPVPNEAVIVTLRDQRNRTVEVLSYHLPAGTQPATAPQRRTKALKESMRTLAQLAKASKADAILFGGDDNIDEFKGNGSKNGTWKFMLGPATNLRQIRSPKPTHKGGRRIDDFRIKRRGKLKVGKGFTTSAPGDHKIHSRVFIWR